MATLAPNMQAITLLSGWLQLQHRSLFVTHFSFHRQLRLHVDITEPGANAEDRNAGEYDSRSDERDGDQLGDQLRGNVHYTE